MSFVEKLIPQFAFTTTRRCRHRVASSLSCAAGLACLSIVGSLATNNIANAANGTWGNIATSGSGTLWSLTNNWQTVVADGAGSIADFSQLNLGASANPVVNLDSSRSIGQLIFGETSTNANTWTLANNGSASNILTMDNTGGTGGPKITVKNQTANISTELSGIAGLTLTGGNASLVLSGANNYTGGTTINSTAGGNTFSIFVASSTAFGASGAGTDVNFNPGTANKARLVFGSGVVINNNIDLNSINGPAGGNGAISAGSLSGTTVNNDVTATINGTIFVNAVTTSGGTFDGAMPTTNSGAYASNLTNNYLILNGPVIDNIGGILGGQIVAKSLNGAAMNGIIHRGGNVRYSGGGNYYRIEERAGTVQVGATDGIATDAYIDIGGNAGTGNNPAQYAIVDLNGNTQHLVGLTNYLSNGASATVTNTSTTPATLILTPNTNPLESGLTFTGGGNGAGLNASITNATTAGPLSLVMNGDPAGIQYLTTQNGYTGTTTLTSGTLAIGSLANGGVTQSLTTTSGSATATVTDPTGLAIGQTVTGAGVRTYSTNNVAPTTITAINGNQITLSVAATATGTNATQFGVSNGLGISSNAASNLVFNGGILSYVGDALDLNNGRAVLANSLTPSTDRNFTINTGSNGTIDVENFTNASNVTSTITLTMSGASAATNGVLNKSGPGTLILTGTNQHTGGTNVTGGTLLVTSPGSLATGPVSVANLATLGGNGTIGGTVTPLSGGIVAPGNPAVNSGVGTMSVGGLALNSGATVNFEFGTGNDQITVTGAGGLTANGGNINLFNAGTTTAFSTNGTYTLMNINGAIGGALSNLTVTDPTAGKVYTIGSTASAVQLTIGNAATAEWTNGAGNGNWTTGGVGGNWVDPNNSNAPVAFPNAIGVTAKFGSLGGGGTVTLNSSDTVSGLIFDNASYTISGSGSLILNNGAAASAVTVNNGSHTVSVPISLAKATSIAFSANTSLTIGGAISGGQPVNASGLGTLTLTGNNAYSSTSVSGSTLNVGTSGGSDTTGTLGSGDVTLFNGGSPTGATLNFNRSNAYSFSGNIAGSGLSAGVVDQFGTGATSIGGSVTNIINLNVQAGSLAIGGALSQTGGVNVTGNGGLGNTGSGSLSIGGALSGGGAVNIDSSGTVTLNGAGSWAGGTTLNHGTLVLNNASAYPANSLLVVNGGTLDLHGNSITVGNTNTAVGTTGGIITNNGPANSTSTFNFSGPQPATNGYFIDAALQDGTGKLAVTTAISVLNSFGTAAQIVHFDATGTYSGGTTVKGHSIEADANDAFGTGPVTVNVNNGSTNWSQIYVGPNVTIHNSITIGQGKPTTGVTGAIDGVIQQSAAGGNATVDGSVTILANNVDGGLFNGPQVGGSDFLNINGPVIASGTANTIIQIGGNVKYGDTTGTSSYSIFQINGQADLGASNALNQTAVVEMSAVANTTAASSGTFDLNGFNQTVTALFANSTTLTSTVQNSGAGPNTLILNTTAANDTAGTNTFNGNIQGNINLTVGGSGTQKLTSPGSSYTGITTITGSAVLEATSVGTVGASSSIGAPTTNDPSLLVFDGGTLRYTGVDSTPNTDRGFTINNGKTAIIDVQNATTDLTLNGSSVGGGGVTGGLTKAGLGTLTLGAGTTHAYTGNTTINAGTLVVNTSLSNTTHISIASTGKLSGTGSIGGTLTHTAGIINPGDPATNQGIGTLTFTGALTLNGGTVQYDVDGSSFSNPQDLVKANGGLSIAGPTAIDLEFLNPSAPPTSPFDFVLFNYTGTPVTLGQTANLNFQTNLAGRSVYTTNVSTPGEVIVHVVPGAPAALKWNSPVAGSGVWDVNTTPNWLNTGTSLTDKYFNGDTVTFADGSFQTAITLNSTVSNSSINVTSNSNNYTISGTGKISGNASLTMSGSSTLTMQANNDYSGGTTISAGTVNVGGNSNHGSLGTGTITNNSHLIFSRTDGNTLNPISFVNTITGTGDLTLSFGGTASITGSVNQASLLNNGIGAANLTNSLTTTGGVTVSAGSLSVTGSTNTGSAGVTVSGSGSINLAGGLSGSGGVTMNSTGSFAMGSGSSYDGNTIINSGTFFPNDQSAFGDTTGTTTVNAGGSIYNSITQNPDFGGESVTINGTGTGNNGALHAGGATTTTFDGTITLGSDSLINLDGGATLSLTGLTNGTALAGAHALSLAGTGTLSIGGNITGVTGIATVTGSTVAFAPASATTLTITTPISGSGNIAANGATPDQNNLATTVLADNPAFTGAITVNTGNLKVQTNNALGTTAGGTTINGNPNSNEIVGSLQLAPSSGNLAIAENLTLNGRQGPGANVPHIDNLSGNNTLSGTITLGTGGDQYNLQSTSGSLTIQGAISTTALTSQRIFKLSGAAGNGTLAGGVTDNATAPLSIEKSGAGSWTLSTTNNLNGALVLSDSGALKIASGTSQTFPGIETSTTGLSVNSNDSLYIASGSPHIDLGTGTGASLHVGDSSATAWPGTKLTIDNWTYGAGSVGDHFVVGVTSTANPSGTGLTAAELAQIQFTDFRSGAQIATIATAARSIGEVVPTVGDVNQDGVVNVADVAALMSGLSNITAFQIARAATSPSGLFTASDAKFLLDVDGNGVDTNTDIQAEISLLANIANGGSGVGGGSGSVQAVPEPASFLLLALGGLALAAHRFRRNPKNA